MFNAEQIYDDDDKNN